MKLAMSNELLAKNVQLAISNVATNGQSPMANLLRMANRQWLISSEGGY